MDMASPPTLTEVRDRFDEAFVTFRRDAMIFSVATVILTPVFLAVAVFLLLAMLLYVDVPYLRGGIHSSTYASGMTIALVIMFSTFFIRPKAQWRTTKADVYWIGAGAGVLALLLVWTYGFDLEETHPGLFWTVYGVLGLTMLGIVGHAYVPHDHYYLGWYNGGMDDPFTLEDDVDRGHMALGFAVAVPRLILSSYGAIFSDLWIWRGLEEREARCAAEVLHGLTGHDRGDARKALDRATPETRGRVLRILARIGAVRADGKDLSLTAEGGKILGTSAWF